MPRYQASGSTFKDRIRDLVYFDRGSALRQQGTNSPSIPFDIKTMNHTNSQINSLPKMCEPKLQQTADILSPGIQSIANLIKSGKIARIVALTGAGILDFRSPTTGLYDKLAPLKLPYPEAIFHVSYFSHTSEPFYASARARHPGNLKPTITRAFPALLAKKSLLHFLFAQNIDGFEHDSGVPVEKVLWAHGDWKSQHCYKCKTNYPDDFMNEAIRLGEVKYRLYVEVP